MAATASFGRKTTSGASGIGRAATRLATGGAKAPAGKAKTASTQHSFVEAPVAGGPMTPEQQPLVSAPAPATGGAPAPISGGATVPGSPAGGTAAQPQTPAGAFQYVPPTSPPGSAQPEGWGPAPGGGAWDAYQAPQGYLGPGAWSTSPPVPDPVNPGRTTDGRDLALAQATYTPPRPSPPGFAPDGRPWWMVNQNAAANAANPNYVPFGYEVPGKVPAADQAFAQSFGYADPYALRDAMRRQWGY